MGTDGIPNSGPWQFLWLALVALTSLIVTLLLWLGVRSRAVEFESTNHILYPLEWRGSPLPPGADVRDLIILDTPRSMNESPLRPIPVDQTPGVQWNELPSPFFARGLTDEELLAALDELQEDPQRRELQFDTLQCLLTEVDARRLLRAAPTLRRKFSDWQDPIAKMLLAACLTAIADFSVIPHAKRMFGRGVPLGLRINSSSVLRSVWTTEEMRQLAGDVDENASIRRVVTACLQNRSALERRFVAEHGVIPERASGELLNRLLMEETDVKEVVLCELYRRSK